MKSIHTLSATELHRQLGQVIRRCFRDKDHFVIERGGAPLVVIIPIDDYQRHFTEATSSKTSTEAASAE
jgi:prevent-host-death family protein